MYNLSKRDKACLLLPLSEMLGVKKRFEFLSLFDDIGEIFDTYRERREDIIAFSSDKFYDKICELIEANAVDRLIDECMALDIIPISYTSSRYPDKLRQIFSPPVALFCKGRVELLDKDPSLGVVGTRRASRYATDVTKSFCTKLSTNGITIVSGMAKGIDGYAHLSTLDNGGDTIAVLGCGVDRVYPSENRHIYDRLIVDGLVVSEYLPKTEPMPYRFPERNRIVVGLSDGILVVEAGEKSGSLITLDLAIEEGRECFIVPQNVDTRTGRGSNERLRAMPDSLVIDAEDILSRFGIKEKGDNITDSIQLDFIEMKIVELLELGERHFDEILELVDIKASELTGILTRLEIMGVVKDLGSNYYGV